MSLDHLSLFLRFRFRSQSPILTKTQAGGPTPSCPQEGGDLLASCYSPQGPPAEWVCPTTARLPRLLLTNSALGAQA